MSKWIKKGDQVVVIAGNDKGKKGKVITRLEDKVVVEKVNLRKRHLKSKSKQGASEIVEMEKPIHISNVCLCNDKGDPIRVRVRESSNGKKELYYLDGEKEVVHRELRKGA